MRNENKLYTHEELIQRRVKLSERLKKVLKASGVGLEHFANLSGFRIENIRKLVEKSYDNSSIGLKAEDQDRLEKRISLLEKMVKVGFLPVPNTYSKHCKRHLINALINYYYDRVKNRVPLDSYKDVIGLEPTDRERSSSKYIL